jgi:hypothetical protein
MDTLQYWRLILSLPTGKSSTRARAGGSSLVKFGSQLKVENLLEAYQREHGGCEAANLLHSIPTSFHSCGEYQLIMGLLVTEEALEAVRRSVVVSHHHPHHVPPVLWK